LSEKREMAHESRGRKTQMMLVEWAKSTSTEGSIHKLVDVGVLPDATIEG
jgi:hypothetical protein